MKRKLIVVVLLGALLTAVFAPALAGNARAATHARTHAAAFDKTRFLLHLGFAYFAFHHWVWKPYKAHKLGRLHLVTTIKAGLALLFAYHEVKVAYGIAKGSKSKTLQLIIAPMNKLGDAFHAVGNKLKKGDVSNSDLNSLNTQATGLQTLSGSNGYPITDKQTKISGVG